MTEIALTGRKAGGPFSHTAFTVIWAATSLSLTGIAISDAASAWLMTTLDPDPRAVSLVQAASNLPMFLFTLPAGAVADLVRPRVFLIGLESFIVVMMTAFGAAVYAHWLTPGLLLAVVFILGASWSLGAPAWMSVTPMLVPTHCLEKANATNSVGYNVSRALGPAIAGYAIARFGGASPYWLFAAADLASVAALLWWRAPETRSHAQHETFYGAIVGGVRLAATNHGLRLTLWRTLAIYPFAAAYPALLPLVAKKIGGTGPETFGFLLGLVSIGAVLGAFALDKLRKRRNADQTVAIATVGLAAGLALFAVSATFTFAAGAALICGASWTIVLASLYCSAQLALPDASRGRGLGVFLTAIFGCVTAGSALWGQIAELGGLSLAFVIAAGAALAVLPLSRQFSLLGAERG